MVTCRMNREEVVTCRGTHLQSLLEWASHHICCLFFPTEKSFTSLLVSYLGPSLTALPWPESRIFLSQYCYQPTQLWNIFSFSHHIFKLLSNLWPRHMSLHRSPFLTSFCCSRGCLIQVQNTECNPAAPDLDMNDLGLNQIHQATLLQSNDAMQQTQTESSHLGLHFSALSGGTLLPALCPAGSQSDSTIPEVLLTPAQLCLKLLQVCSQSFENHDYIK